jgi:hypothetical protein
MTIYQEITEHLDKGGEIIISTYGHATRYKPKHKDFFSVGRDGNIYVRSGRRKECLTTQGGNVALVSIRLSV